MAKKRVLLIDDESWLTDLLASTLKAAGYVVDTVHNALAAMQVIDARRPDMIVLDMFMPGPNGIVLLHELQSYSDLAAIPVVLCTNTAMDIVENSLQPYGVRRILDKTTMEPADIVAAAKRYA